MCETIDHQYHIQFQCFFNSFIIHPNNINIIFHPLKFLYKDYIGRYYHLCKKGRGEKREKRIEERKWGEKRI